MKRIIALTMVCVFALLVLVSCGNKTALTNDGFIKKAEDFGLQTQNTKSSYLGNSTVESCTTAYVAEGSTVKWQCDFLILTQEDYAIQSFENNKSSFESSVSGASSRVSSNMGNYEKFELNSDGKFMYICRVGKTLVYVNADDSYKSDIKSFINKLGY